VPVSAWPNYTEDEIQAMLEEECAFRQEELAFQVNDGANHGNNRENNIPVPFLLPAVRDHGGLRSALLSYLKDVCYE